MRFCDPAVYFVWLSFGNRLQNSCVIILQLFFLITFFNILSFEMKLCVLDFVFYLLLERVEFTLNWLFFLDNCSPFAKYSFVRIVLVLCSLLYPYIFLEIPVIFPYPRFYLLIICFIFPELVLLYVLVLRAHFSESLICLRIKQNCFLFRF